MEDNGSICTNLIICGKNILGCSGQDAILKQQIRMVWLNHRGSSVWFSSRRAELVSCNPQSFHNHLCIITSWGYLNNNSLNSWGSLKAHQTGDHSTTWPSSGEPTLGYYCYRGWYVHTTIMFCSQCSNVACTTQLAVITASLGVLQLSLSPVSGPVTPAHLYVTIQMTLLTRQLIIAQSIQQDVHWQLLKTVDLLLSFDFQHFSSFSHNGQEMR